MTTYAHLMNLVEKGERVHDLDLRGADLIHVDFSHVSADLLGFYMANLQRVKFCAARLGDCHFHGAHLEESDWSDAIVRMCVFDGATATGARFDGARLEDSSVKGADLTRVSLRNARLTETSFNRALLCEASLDNAQGDGVEFRGADLRGASLRGARLDEADFRGADLRSANLSNGRFHAADFRGALLDDALFTNADLQGALFDQEYERGAESTTEPTDESQGLEEALRAAWQKISAELPDRSAEIEELLGMEDASMENVVENLKRIAADLDGAAVQPPDVWRSWLEPLLAQTESGQPLDLDALLKALSAMIERTPPSPQAAYTRRRATNSKTRKRRKHR